MGRLSVRLPEFDDTYDGRKMRELSRHVEMTFAQMYAGRVYPYGAFCDTTDQVTASGTAANAVTLNTTDHSNGVEVVSDSHIAVREAGYYNVQFSAQLKNTDSSAHDASIWLRANGVDVANSSTQVTVPAKHGGVDGHLVAAWNFLVFLGAGEYCELYWQADDTSVSLEHKAAQTSPTRPVTPSVILTVSFVSQRA